MDPAVSVTRLGVTELPECGTNDEVLACHGLDEAALLKAFRSAAGRRRARVVSQPA
jgi:hypothetical protein